MLQAIALAEIIAEQVYKRKIYFHSSTTIESRKFRIPSDLRRQPGYRPVSSKVGDHLRILLGVVVQSLFGGLIHHQHHPQSEIRL
jgi:hypothetical protein